MKIFAAILTILLSLAGGAQAECPAGWGGNGTLTAATAFAEFATARLTLNQAANVTLHPVSEVRFAAPPEKRGDASSYGGMLELHVREAGTYRISLSSGAWIDVVKDGAVIASTVHGHGADCSGLRKMVSFTLQPGRHVIQISGNKDDTIRVIAART